MGDSMRPFIFISAASVMNIALDLLFVMGLGLGSAGAAAATVLSQCASFAACAFYIARNRDRYSLDLTARTLLRIEPELLSRLIKLGFPMAIKQASVLLSKLFVNSWINSYGVAVSAFAGIANKMSSSTNVLSNAFNTAGASMVGQNIGARRYERVKQVMLAVFRCTVSAAAVISVLIVLFPDQIYGFFTVDPQVLAIGRRYVPIAVLMFFGSAARSGMNALVNGSGNYKANFIMAVLDGIVMRIGLTLLFGLALGMRHYGFWLGDALAGYTPFVIGLIFYFSGAWRKR
jgi:putative MATE family efflux protein